MSLAIECGATTSDVFLVDDDGNIQKRLLLGSANYVLMDESELEGFFLEIRHNLLTFRIHSIGIGMPGIVDIKDRQVKNFNVSFYTTINTSEEIESFIL